jgi:hypothetical protein
VYEPNALREVHVRWMFTRWARRRSDVRNGPFGRVSLRCMTSSTSKPSNVVKLRRRLPWFALAGILFVTLLTIGGAAANMMPHHLKTARELQREEQTDMIEARRARIATLLAEGDRCRAPIARELARALVYDGRSAVPYADDYERRCGDDPIVRRWANASAMLAGLRRKQL